MKNETLKNLTGNDYMQTNKYLLILLILLLLFVPLTAGAESPPLRNIELDSKTYDYLKYLELKGEISPVFNGSLPLTYAEVEQALLELENKKELTAAENRIYNFLAQELEAGNSFNNNLFYSNQLSGRFLNNSADNNYALDLKSAVWTQPNSHFFAESRLEFTAGTEGLHLGLSPAYFKVKYQPFELEIGKSRLKWGPGQFASLSLATDSYPTPYFYSNRWFKNLEEIDLFKVSAELGPTEISYFTAADYYFWGQREGQEPALSGLRADWRVNDYLRIGAGDTVVSPDSLETTILVTDPLSYFTDLVDSPQQDQNVNVMGTADFTLNLGRQAQIYGEYIWDSTVGEDSKEDYGTEEAGPKTAFLTGFYLPFAAENGLYSFKAEYAAVDDTTYTFPYDQNLVYQYGESWLGHWAGPDSKTVVLELKADYHNDWEVKFSYTTVEQGLKIGAEKEMEIYTFKTSKKINKNNKITAYLQRTQGEQLLKGAADAAALEYQIKF